MALISNTETKLKDGTEILILNPSAEDSAPLLLAMQRIIKESKHLLIQSDEFNLTVEAQEKRMVLLSSWWVLPANPYPVKHSRHEACSFQGS